MISKRMEEAMNAQVNAEFWSAYLYLSMAMHFESEGYKGIANWFAVQFKEEQDHATIFINHINSRDGKVTLMPIDKVDTSWDSILHAFEETLRYEKIVTGRINDLYTIALEENDYASQSMLKWFIDEQVEEEETARDYIDALKKIGDHGYGLYMFDKELAARTYAVPEPLSNQA